MQCVRMCRAAASLCGSMCAVTLSCTVAPYCRAPQAPAKHQKFVASVLGVPQHKVVSKTKRLGGGFGGKETRGIFLHCAAAVPAARLKRPVRLCLDRDEDMQMTGALSGVHTLFFQAAFVPAFFTRMEQEDTQQVVVISCTNTEPDACCRC